MEETVIGVIGMECCDAEEMAIGRGDSHPRGRQCCDTQ